jgi:outer membrane biosynthesis protein TonB
MVSRTGTNIVRFAVAALLGLAACLVAWWPQSAAGSGDAAVVSSPVAAAPTQKTPTVTPHPTATVAPTTAAPPPAPPPAQPTPKPTKKPTKKPKT